MDTFIVNPPIVVVMDISLKFHTFVEEYIRTFLESGMEKSTDLIEEDWNLKEFPAFIRSSIESDCLAFITDAEKYDINVLESFSSARFAGHDFCMTRNYQNSGFQKNVFCMEKKQLRY